MDIYGGRHGAYDRKPAGCPRFRRWEPEFLGLHGVGFSSHPHPVSRRNSYRARMRPPPIKLPTTPRPVFGTQSHSNDILTSTVDHLDCHLLPSIMSRAE